MVRFSDARRAAPPATATVTGRVVRLLDGYPREIRIGRPVLVAVLTAAGLARPIGLLVGRRGGRRRWREMRRGPEFLVTPLQLRTPDGAVRHLEIHGHLPQTALEPADHIQVTVRPQRDSQLPPRVLRIVNLTTGQLLTPRTPTLWSHLGPALLGQALLGLVLAAAVLTWAVVRS